jgi:predicted N-acetyltransferase YhbS
MMDAIRTRAVYPEEIPLVRGIIERAFKTEDDVDLFDCIAARDREVVPEGIRVALAGETPVACAVVLLRDVMTPRGLVKGAVLTLVGCEPDCQGRGYGGATVRDALQYMSGLGCAVAVLYGHHSYYPRFGFALVMPRVTTTVTISPDSVNSPSEVALRPATDADIPAVSELYARTLGLYSCSVARPEEPWIWSYRRTSRCRTMVLGEALGYVLVEPEVDAPALHVPEAAVDRPGDAAALLQALCSMARSGGLRELKIGLPPGEPLVKEAVRRGAACAVLPPGAGMAAVLDWRAVLPPDYRVVESGLTCRGEAVLEAGRDALTRLVLGTESASDLAESSQVQFSGSMTRRRETDVLASLVRDFPTGFPRWFIAPFWYG